MVNLHHLGVFVSVVIIANVSFSSAARQSQQQMAGAGSVMMKPEGIDIMKKQAAERSAGRSSTSGATSNPSDAQRLDGYTDEARDDFVTYLPGWGDVRDFNLFAGYV